MTSQGEISPTVPSPGAIAGPGPSARAAARRWSGGPGSNRSGPIPEAIFAASAGQSQFLEQLGAQALESLPGTGTQQAEPGLELLLKRRPPALLQTLLQTRLQTLLERRHRHGLDHPDDIRSAAAPPGSALHARPESRRPPGQSSNRHRRRLSPPGSSSRPIPEAIAPVSRARASSSSGSRAQALESLPGRRDSTGRAGPPSCF